MRTAGRLLSPRLPSRRGVVAHVLVLSVAGAVFTWHGSVLAAAVPVIAFAIGVVVYVLIRNSLRRASAQIDAILREELGQDADRRAAARTDRS